MRDWSSGMVVFLTSASLTSQRHFYYHVCVCVCHRTILGRASSITGLWTEQQWKTTSRSRDKSHTTLTLMSQLVNSRMQSHYINLTFNPNIIKGFIFNCSKSTGLYKQVCVPRKSRLQGRRSATRINKPQTSVNCVDKKNQLDVTFCILYFSSNSCSTCFGQPCAHRQELTTAWCYNLVLVCAVAAGRLSRPVGR
jgi:hypothetical protein